MAEGLAVIPPEHPTPVKIEHPSGSIDVVFDYEIVDGWFKLNSAGLLRTARKLFAGAVSIPGDVWPEKAA